MTSPTPEEKQKAHAALRIANEYEQKAAVRYKKFIRNEVRKAGGWKAFGYRMHNTGYAVMARYRLQYGSLQSLKEMAELIGEKIYGG